MNLSNENPIPEKDVEGKHRKGKIQNRGAEFTNGFLAGKYIDSLY
jgi:hypothetical protein